MKTNVMQNRPGCQVYLFHEEKFKSSPSPDMPPFFSLFNKLRRL